MRRAYRVCLTVIVVLEIWGTGYSVVSNVKTASNRLAITIDDNTDKRTLNILQEKNVRVTFFPIGYAISKNPNLWKRAVAEGHELGNHTWSHAWITRLESAALKNELSKWQEAVEKAVGYNYPAIWFRPPYLDGFTNWRRTKEIRTALSSGGYITVLWDIETGYALYSKRGPQQAGPNPGPKAVANYVVNRAKPGSIILLHGGRDILALPSIIDGLRARGLQPVTLTDLIKNTPPTKLRSPRL